MDAVSLAYNVAMVNRLANIQKDYISVCCTTEQVARLRWSLECKHHIEECEMELRKHKVMTAIDFTSLVVSGLLMLRNK